MTRAVGHYAIVWSPV